MAAPPPSSLSAGIPLILGDSQDAVLTEATGTAPAVVLIYARGRGGTNPQQVLLGAGAAVPLKGSQVERILLDSGAVNYVIGQSEVPSYPAGTEVPVKLPNPLPVSSPSPLDVSISDQTAFALQGYILSPFGGAAFPAGYASGGSPSRGIWRGYAVSVAAGEVSVNGIVLGTATAAGQAFFFTIWVDNAQTAVLVNCTVQGGGISI